jgi:outer membrane protein OmpA-like peptidoglycan-associated protein
VEFENNSTIITKSSYPAIDTLVSILNSDTHLKLRITGHTDDVGNDISNVQLSKQRAESVKQFFLSRGVPANRFEIEYFGETKPVTDNITEAGKKKNRRVEFLFIFD